MDMYDCTYLNEEFDCSYMVSEVNDSQFYQDKLTQPNNISNNCQETTLTQNKSKNKLLIPILDILNIEADSCNIMKTQDTSTTHTQSPSVYIRELGTLNGNYETNVNNFDSI
jgi:hypothetical protein